MPIGFSPQPHIHHRFHIEDVHGFFAAWAVPLLIAFEIIPVVELYLRPAVGAFRHRHRVCVRNRHNKVTSAKGGFAIRLHLLPQRPALAEFRR